MEGSLVSSELPYLNCYSNTPIILRNFMKLFLTVLFCNTKELISLNSIGEKGGPVSFGLYEVAVASME